jgi:hypothetical protein
VAVLDQYNNWATSYRGTIHFTGSDASATLPADYTFTASDGGRHAFSDGVILRRTGTQTVTATDTLTSSITGTARVSVLAAPATSTALLNSTPPAQAYYWLGKKNADDPFGG